MCLIERHARTGCSPVFPVHSPSELVLPFPDIDCSWLSSAFLSRHLCSSLGRYIRFKMSKMVTFTSSQKKLVCFVLVIASHRGVCECESTLMHPLFCMSVSHDSPGDDISEYQVEFLHDTVLAKPSLLLLAPNVKVDVTIESRARVSTSTCSVM
jgi:hypothetical protein